MSINEEEDNKDQDEIFRFIQDLEFVQCLANPNYLKYLSDKGYLDDLYSGFKNADEIEEIITEIVTKMENLKEGHEVSAYVGLQLQEMIEQQEKLGNEINNNSQILINLKKNIKNNIEIMRKNIELLKAKINSKK